jgi:phage terminase small subunit
LTAEAAERVGVSIERVLTELAKIGFANINDYVDVTGDGPRIALGQLPPEKLAAISEIQTDTLIDRTKTDEAGNFGEVRRVKIKLWDKKGALVDLGRHLGMFVDKTETKLSGGIPVALLTQDDVGG